MLHNVYIYVYICVCVCASVCIYKYGSLGTDETDFLVVLKGGAR